ncbi:MAG: hypothetical protein IPO27_09155 [Bacteroidetes bacterium]|nr:hypothetical protein [Bacteroidota bacterium]
MKRSTLIIIVLLAVVFFTGGYAFRLLLVKGDFNSNKPLMAARFANQLPDIISAEEEIKEMPKAATASSNFSISVKSITRYKNLSMFALISNTELDAKKYITLQEAIKKGMAIVHETEDVNNLSITNKSNSFLFVNAGDIVKGGKQDRTLATDLIIGPNQQRVKLASFCVEHGRWSNRAGEVTTHFNASEKSLSSNELKIAAKRQRNQSQVWEKVSVQQNKLTDNISKITGAKGYIASDEASRSSLQLTLENSVVDSLLSDYKKYLQHALKQDGVNGVAFFINGKFYALDIYNNAQLFNDLANKLLEAAITEAISEYNENITVNPLNTEHLMVYLKKEFKVDNTINPNKYTTIVNKIFKDKSDIFLFETIDTHATNWLHRNILVDVENTASNIKPQQSNQYLRN